MSSDGRRPSSKPSHVRGRTSPELDLEADADGSPQDHDGDDDPEAPRLGRATGGPATQRRQLRWAFAVLARRGVSQAQVTEESLVSPERARFWAAQRVALTEGSWTKVRRPSDGEEIWRKDGDSVRLTLDGWLVYVTLRRAGAYAKRMRATAELVAAIRGRRPRA